MTTTQVQRSLRTRIRALLLGMGLGTAVLVTLLYMVQACMFLRLLLCLRRQV